jgi:hypothetical protein
MYIDKYVGRENETDDSGDLHDKNIDKGKVGDNENSDERAIDTVSVKDGDVEVQTFLWAIYTYLYIYIYI